MFRLFTIFICLTTVVYGNPLKGFQNNKFDSKIAGGKPVNISEIPYQVSLHIDSRYKYNCGGTLLSKNYVLTAAHCLSSYLTVRIGSSYHNSGGVLVNVENTYRHPLFKYETADYDFAILKLENWNSTNVTHGFAKLPKQDEDVEDGELLRVSGWGRTLNPAESNIQLRAVNVPKVNQDVCKKAYYYSVFKITDRMICTGFKKGGKNSCKGDSGSPLVRNNDTVVGVVSWGSGCALPEYPAVYSRVAAVRDWIEEITSI